MNIKVAAFTVGEKSSNTMCQLSRYHKIQTCQSDNDIITTYYVSVLEISKSTNVLVNDIITKYNVPALEISQSTNV